jgi:ribosomal protein S12 methylthiotransferase accessory factor YcaO
MVERTALARTGIGEKGLQRIEAKNAPGVDGVGVAAQVANLREGIGFRLQLFRRTRLRASPCVGVEGP